MWLRKVTVVMVLAFVINVNSDCEYEDSDDYDYWGCPENEYMNECATEFCEGEYCPLTDKDLTQDQCPQQDPYNCRTQRCMCDFNYLRNVTGECIPPHLCPPIKCTGRHEVLSQIPPTCPGESCNEAIMNPARCALRPRIPVRPKPTCVCKKGYYRNEDGFCVPFKKCPQQACPPGENLNTCPPKFCSGQFCPSSPTSNLTCPPRDECGIPQCQCNFNTRRNRLGICVPISKCPPFTCKGPNEEYNGCPPVCPGEKCTDYINNSTCPKYRIGIVVECKPACRCKKGYYRNEKNICVIASNCEPIGCNGDPNAVKGCDCGRTCKLYKEKIACKKICKPNDCKCKTGYVLNEKTGKCVMPDQCPLVCNGPNEYYACGGACDNVCATLSEQNQTNCPIVNIRCNDMCYCDDGFARNKDNICVPYDECELKCDGPHEHYDCGVQCDNVCETLSVQNQTHCPYINKKCNRMCYCDDGYARNKDKVCVPYEQCEKNGCNGDPNAVKGCDCGRTCKLYKKKIACKKICKPNDCKCKTGYVLNEKTGKCVLPNRCPLICNRPNEHYACGGACDNVCATLSEQNQTNCPIKNIRCNDKCYCNDGFARNKDNICVPYDECEQKCNKPNEFYSPAYDWCPPQTCKAYLAGWACTQVVREPQAGCRCIDGYYRTDDGDCIPAKKCSVGAVTSSEENEKLFSEATAKFTQKFAMEVAARNSGKSVIFSAFSVEPLLAQLALGTVGESHDQMLRVIGLKDDNFIKEVFPITLGKLAKTEGVTLKMAARCYSMKGFEVEPSFRENSIKLFNSDMEPLDFSQAEASADTMNSWVAANTNDKIKNLVSKDSLSALTRLVMLNAIYFKGDWKVKFNKDLTRDRDFHVSPTEKVQIPMMHIKSEYNYYESKVLDCKILEIPYVKEQVSMIVYLPNKIDGLTNLLNAMQNTTNVAEEKKKMYSTEVEVQLPKFKIETTTDLKMALKKMGIEKIFGADSGMEKILKNNQEKLYVSDAIQKAFIEVNEEGSEAAAANVFEIQYLSAAIDADPQFIADHPFLFYVVNQNYALFSGTYAN